MLGPCFGHLWTRLLGTIHQKPVWCLVGNEGMGYRDYYKGPSGTIIGHRDPFPHSLPSTRQKPPDQACLLQPEAAPVDGAGKRSNASESYGLWPCGYNRLYNIPYNILYNILYKILGNILQYTKIT